MTVISEGIILQYSHFSSKDDLLMISRRVVNEIKHTIHDVFVKHRWLITCLFSRGQFAITFFSHLNLPTYSKRFLPTMNKIHSLLHYSLNEALHHPRCATAAWMSSDIGRKRVMNSDVKSLYWIDEDFEMISISFPAKLNLEGPYSQLNFRFNNDSFKKVRSSVCHLLIK